jgi:hypothetical protein
MILEDWGIAPDPDQAAPAISLTVARSVSRRRLSALGTGAAAATAVAAASGAFGARTATRKGVIMRFRTRIAVPALSRRWH